MDNRYDLIIVGAGPAGISAAIYAARARLKTLVIDSGESGGQIRITSEVVNYPGIASISGAELSDTMRRQAESFGARLLHASIEKTSLNGDWKRLETNLGTFESLGVILATGARPRKAGFAGEEEYRGRGIGYCATCDGEFFTGMEVFVVGGGFAAAEEAIFLTRYARKVTVLVRDEAFTCSASIAEKVLAHPNIQVKFRHEVIEVSGDQVLREMTVRDNAAGETWTHRAEPGETFGVFVFAGYEPMSELVRDQVELDSQGYIPTDDDLRTNIEGVYAAGDVRPKKLRQLVTAVSDGAVASTNAERYIKEKREALSLGDWEEKPRAKEKKTSLLDDDLKAQLAPILERLERDLYLAVLPGDDAQTEEEMRSLTEGLATLSGKLHPITLTWDDPALQDPPYSREKPALLLLDSEKNPVGISYQAVPGGHEFNSFVLALYNAAGPGQTISPETLEAIRSIQGPVHLQVGVTLSCTMCPDVVQGSQLIAVNNPGVTLEVIDISRNSAFRKEHHLMSVPALVRNGTDVSFGRKSLEEIVDFLRN